MPRRKIRHAQFDYYVPTEATDMKTGKTTERLSRRIALGGKWVDIPRDEDIERGEKMGAFFTEEELHPQDPDTGGDDSGLSDDDIETDDDLVSWIKGEQGDKPTAPQVVERAGDDPDTARELLDAERQAADDEDREPRTSVVQPLEGIANR